MTRIPSPPGIIIERSIVNLDSDTVDYTVSLAMSLTVTIALEADDDINYQRATLQHTVSQLATRSIEKLRVYAE